MKPKLICPVDLVAKSKKLEKKILTNLLSRKIDELYNLKNIIGELKSKNEDEKEYYLAQLNIHQIYLIDSAIIVKKIVYNL